jgi:potassium-transporting ATPase potassium-binding subunit
MTGNDWFQIGLYLAVLLVAVPPLGAWMARVYQGEALPGLGRLLGPLERGLYWLIRTDPSEEMTWRTYAAAVLCFNLLGFLAVYVLQRVQGWLPLNPDGMGAVPPPLAFNTAVSFASNTNWQAYGGEPTLS